MSTIDTPGERKIVTFSLGDQIFGIDMAALVEIREWEEPTPLPGSAAFIKGVTNLRGTVVPVIGLAERLGWPPSKLHARSCILVVNIGDKQAGFLVDEVADIVPIQQNEVQPAPDIDIAERGVIAGLVTAATRGGDGSGAKAMVLLLDLDALSMARPLDIAA